MRMMSFSLTTPQFIAREKTVTRRCGWRKLKVGDLIQGVEKGMGLRLGEKVNRLGVIRIVSVRQERLCEISPADVVFEGFPDMTTSDFISLFCKSHSCPHDEVITRIEFEYV